MGITLLPKDSVAWTSDCFSIDTDEKPKNFVRKDLRGNFMVTYLCLFIEYYPMVISLKNYILECVPQNFMNVSSHPLSNHVYQANPDEAKGWCD